MADRPPLHDYSRSRAVVMGTWDYTFLDPVPPAENSMRRMAGLLAGPLCGWPRERLLVLENQRSPGDLPDRLITAFDGISDVALFYYVGHGQMAPDDQLCLGLVQSRPEANRRAATSLRFSDVRHALQDSSAAIKIVILDCCFAGLATTGALAGLAGDVLDLTAGTGAYTMAATSAYATAWYEDSAGLARPQTYFTKYLVDLIEEGIPGQAARLRLDPLYKKLRDNLDSDQRPVPRSRAVNDAREFEFAYNAAPAQTHRDPDQELAKLTAEVQALKAEAAERDRELARLKEQASSAWPRTAEQQRELQDAIDEATRQLDDTRAAEAAALAASRGRHARDGNQEPMGSGPALQQADPPSAPQPESATASRSGALDAPTIMRIGAARLTAGLDRMPRLDLEAHRDIFGPLPRLSAEELISMSEQVDLRGQGGAAFPFARKLSAVANNAEAKDVAPIVVVNATESEPGSVKDKMLMIRSPYLILSGAALVAEAIGAEEIVVGVTGNELAKRSIEAAIAAEPGLRKIARVVQMPDRFISGESGALVRGINGKRPIPPGRKVLASDFGVTDLPTLLSNAATFAQLAVLALLGPERFAAVGTPEEPGTILLSVGGSAAHPAVIEVPTGVPLAAVLDICQAPAGDGVLVGGYRGMWLPAGTAYVVPVSREGLAAVGGTLGSGIVLPLGDGTCPLGEVSRIASYLAGESAGQCGPCKLGLPSIARALAGLIDGSGGIEALDVARRSAAAVTGRGACTHPDGMTRFVLSALDVFTEDLAAHVFHSSCGRPIRGVLPLPQGPEQEAQRRLIVDWTRCQGHGLCAHSVPELIHLDGQGYPVVLNIPVPDWLEKNAQRAAKKCPTLALRLSHVRPS